MLGYAPSVQPYSNCGQSIRFRSNGSYRPGRVSRCRTAMRDHRLAEIFLDSVIPVDDDGDPNLLGSIEANPVSDPANFAQPK